MPPSAPIDESVAARLPNESADYRKLRAELLEAEIALRDQRERVATLRRRLPQDTIVETDYVLREAAADGVREVRLADLFDDPAKPLVLMHFMFGKQQKSPCPMCTMWADGYDGVVPHLEKRVNFRLLVAGDVTDFARYAGSRGWRNVRGVSAAESSLKLELQFETPEGHQIPGVSVFTLGEDGRVRHFYTASALLAPGEFRGMDLLSPVWNFLDLTPEGRGEWMPSV